jgi:hypothetical protein
LIKLKTQNKPVIEDVIISKEKLEEFNSAVKARSQNKHRVIRDYFGGNCTICAQIPSKKILKDLEGYGQRVEWYCDTCFKRLTE